MGEGNQGEVEGQPRIPPEVAEQLGYYVYMYVHPETKQPFYIGKGQHGRALAHLSATHESHKVDVLNRLRATGLKPRIEVLAHRLPDEQTALLIEAAVIDALGLESLTNEVRGWRSVEMGRVPLSELMARYAAEPVQISHPVILISVARQFRHDMSEDELYDSTRGVWRVGRRRERAEYAFAVYKGVVREVYRINAWHPANSTPYATGSSESRDIPGRWEFTGQRAEESVRSQYVGKSVKSYLPQNQWSAIYVNVPIKKQLRRDV